MITGRSGRVLAISAAVAAAAVSVIAVASGTAATAGRADKATSYVAVTHQVGSNYYAAGETSDTVLGNGAVTYTIKAGTGTKPGTISITANRVTEFTPTGSLYGGAAGTETTSAAGSVTLTGTLTLIHGTGAQKGHSFVGKFTGTGTGPLGPFVFHVTGKYR